ncbi:hypothetical protein Xsze_02043 [Xenorhabdus szentirmaii DSM 16338]|nr:hypothetical protein Xsze_02043 [Xenorhabdus szentirmaii DSM 16338]
MPARAIRCFAMGKLILCIPAVAPDLWAETITLFGFFHQTTIVIIAIADIPLLHDPPGFLMLSNLFHCAVGIDRQVLAQVAVGIITELLFMRTIAVKQGIEDLIITVIAITGLSPPAVVNHAHIMCTVILPAPVDRRGLRRKMRVILCQCFPEKLGGLSRRLMREQSGCGITAGKDKPVGTFPYRFSSQYIMLESQWRMLVELKMIQSPHGVIAQMQSVAIHAFTDRASGQLIPFTNDFPTVDTLTGRQTRGLVILILDSSIGISGFHQLIPFVVFVGGGVFQYELVFFRLPAFLFDQQPCTGIVPAQLLAIGVYRVCSASQFIVLIRQSTPGKIGFTDNLASGIPLVTVSFPRGGGHGI